MPINRNMQFVYNGGDFQITLLCGDTKDGGTYYLPDEMLVVDNESKIKGQYSDDLPIGMPEAFELKLKIDTASFTEETALLGKWIRDNESPTGGAPNVWIFSRTSGGNTIIDFAGVQQSVTKETHSLQKQEYEINLYSAHKIAMENTGIAPTAIEGIYGSGAVLDRDIAEYYVDRRTPDNAVFYQHYAVKGWGWTRSEPLANVLLKLSNAVEREMNKLFRDPDYSFYLHHEIASNFPTFYKRGLDEAGTFVPADNKIVAFSDIQVLSEIWRHTDHLSTPIAFPSELKGGLLKRWSDKYSNVWNLWIAFLEGYALRGLVRYHATSCSIILYPIAKQLPTETINIADLVEMADGESLTEAKEMFTSVSVRNQHIGTGNVTVTPCTVISGSQTKKSYEAAQPAGIEPQAVSKASVRLDDYWHFESHTVYDAKEPTNIPDTELYYAPGGDLGADFLIKLADYCRIPVGANDYVGPDNEGYVPEYWSEQNVSGFSTDYVNTRINALQRNSYAYVCSWLIARVVCRRPLWLEITLPMRKANLNTLGAEYTLNLDGLIKPNHFYDEIELGTRAVLVNVETDYKAKTSKCIFFIRTDQWA